MVGTMATCPVCGTDLVKQGRGWLLECPACGFLQALLEPRFNDANALARIDVDMRSEALKRLRLVNFKTVLQRLGRTSRPGRRLLEVGSAQGWFLQAAAGAGYDVLGIEPDVSAAERTPAGLTVIRGLFPKALPAGARFDVIVFNDVLEHIPDVEAVLGACVGLLAPNGVLAVNAPNRQGVFYRLARALDRLGLPASLERLWQVGFPSPHLYYFTPADLVILGRRHGFHEVERSRLQTLAIRGLWSRIRYDRSVSVPRATALWLGLAPLCLLLAVLPPDISLQIFQRPRDIAPSVG